MPTKPSAIVQSNSIPRKNSLDRINSVDEFVVVVDDAQDTKRDWRTISVGLIVFGIYVGTR